MTPSLARQIELARFDMDRRLAEMGLREPDRVRVDTETIDAATGETRMYATIYPTTADDGDFGVSIDLPSPPTPAEMDAFEAALAAPMLSTVLH